MADDSNSADNAIPYSDLLVMAVALHGSSAKAMREEMITANGVPILRQTLYWAGSWNETTRTALYGEHHNASVDELYATLISMSRVSDSFIKGFGNLGSGDLPPSWPTYIAFGLTARGRLHAKALFAMHPKLRSLRPLDDRRTRHKD